MAGARRLGIGRRLVVTFAKPLARSPWRDARWLVLAPHADDETLGTGALVADAAARGKLAGVVFLTDGSGSRPCPTPAHRSHLIRLRRREAAAAVRILAGPRSSPPLFLDWPDADPHRDDSAAAMRSTRLIVSLIRRLRVDAIATTAADEPHCDHAACHRLAARVVRSLHCRVALFDYRVWGDAPSARRIVRSAPILSGRRRAALRAHASQLGGGDGFRLPPEKRRMAATDLLYLANPYARS